MQSAPNNAPKRDVETDLLWMLLVGFWPYVRFMLGLVAVFALLFGPPGSFVLTFAVGVLLSWMVLNTDPQTGRAPSLAPLAALVKKMFTGR
jgi:hypothetical protein